MRGCWNWRIFLAMIRSKFGNLLMVRYDNSRFQSSPTSLTRPPPPLNTPETTKYLDFETYFDWDWKDPAAPNAGPAL